MHLGLNVSYHTHTLLLHTYVIMLHEVIIATDNSSTQTQEFKQCKQTPTQPYILYRHHRISHGNIIQGSKFNGLIWDSMGEFIYANRPSKNRQIIVHRS